MRRVGRGLRGGGARARCVMGVVVPREGVSEGGAERGFRPPDYNSQLALRSPYAHRSCVEGEFLQINVSVSDGYSSTRLNPLWFNAP